MSLSEWQEDNAYTKKCEICGKIFFAPSPSEYVYKRGYRPEKKNIFIKYFCSWSCMRIFDAEQEEIAKKKRAADRARRSEYIKMGWAKRKERLAKEAQMNKG